MIQSTTQQRLAAGCGDSRPSRRFHTATPHKRRAEPAMDHRVGQRWRTDLPVQTAAGCDGTPQPARLLDLSRNGARIRLNGFRVAPGQALEVWFPGMAAPLHALVIHARADEAGLLWSARPSWLGRLLAAVRGQGGEPS